MIFIRRYLVTAYFLRGWTRYSAHCPLSPQNALVAEAAGWGVLGFTAVVGCDVAADDYEGLAGLTRGVLGDLLCDRWSPIPRTGFVCARQALRRLSWNSEPTRSRGMVVT